MLKLKNKIFDLLVIALVLFICKSNTLTQTQAASIRDVVRVKGMDSSEIVGMGLVVGLSGTGDGGKYTPAMRPLLNMVTSLMDDREINLAELKASKNVALVTLTAIIPAAGVTVGEKLDVMIASVGSAKSLKGGRLFTVPMVAPARRGAVFGFAQGWVVIEDKENLNAGVVKNGVTMTQDVISTVMTDDGKVTLILKKAYANLSMSSYIAATINELYNPDDDGQIIAKAVGPKLIKIDVPLAERKKYTEFIATILGTTADSDFLNTGAKVTINRKTGTIVMSGDVQMAPVVIMHRGLTINTITPKPVPTAVNPKVEAKTVIAVDPLNKGGIKMQALIGAMEKLKVPVEDRISILTEISRAGKLHATLEFED